MSIDKKKEKSIGHNSQNQYKMIQNVLILSQIQFYVIFLCRIIYFLIEKVNVWHDLIVNCVLNGGSFLELLNWPQLSKFKDPLS